MKILNLKENPLQKLRAKVVPMVLPTKGELFGIERSKEIIADGLKLSGAIVNIVNGDIFSSIGIILPIGIKYQGNFKEILGAVWKEVKDYSEEEATQVYEFARNEFDISNDELEAKIEELLELPVVIFKEVKDWEVVVESMKAAFNPSYDVIQSREAFHGLVDEAHDAIEIAQFYMGLIINFSGGEKEAA